MENQSNTPEAFGFAGEELARIILGNLGLKCNRLSAFQSDGAAPASSSEEALKALGFPEFQRAAAILANPLIKLSAAKGGGALPVEKFSVFGSPQPSGMEFAALLHPGDATLVLYFASQSALLEWWTGLFACQSNSPVVNRLLPALPLEEFAFLLHVLDSFRRISMQSMLLYQPLKDCRISAPDFAASFEVALNSGDIRWLMPALFSLTPGFSGKLLDLQPDMLIVAEMLEFVRRTTDPVSGVDELVYLEPAIALGSEFVASWMWGLGLTVEVLNGDRTRQVAREFLAPTALSNHLFTVEKGQAGLDMFTHLALTLDEYGGHMTSLLQNAKAKAMEPVPEPQVVAQGSPQKPAPTVPEVRRPAPAAVPAPTKATQARPRSATTADIFTLSIKCEEQRMIMSGQMHLGGAADNDLVLPGEKVAPHHALIQKQGLVYKITDLSGENGTFVNGKRITGPTLLKSGDIVLIGDSQLTISDQP